MGLIIGIDSSGIGFSPQGQGQANEPISEQFYGVEFDTQISNPLASRIGKIELHHSLPIHSKMKRCVLKDSGEVAYYLNPHNSNLKENGEPAVLDGTDGQVMVEIPSFYYRFVEEGTRRRVMISEQEIAGFKLWKKCYVSAYEATIQRSTNKLSSVVNTSPDYRGGNNDASRDNTVKSLLGKPASNFTLDEARTYARNRGSANWNCYLYSIHKMLCWLFVVEYATLNTQLDYTAERYRGFSSGGLGRGVNYLRYNDNPSVDCGITNEFGNKTAVVSIYAIASTSTRDSDTKREVSVPTYRGIENPFGDIGQIADGIVAYNRAESNAFEIFTAENDDILANRDKKDWRFSSKTTRRLGYISAVSFGEYGDILPTEVGSGSNFFFGDQFLFTKGDYTEGVFSLGGDYYMGWNSNGMFASHIIGSEEKLGQYGTRLCYITQ